MDNIQEVQDNPPVPTPAPVRQKRKRHRQNTLLPQRPKKPATGYTMFLRNYFSTHPTQDGISVSFKCNKYFLVSRIEKISRKVVFLGS